MPELSHQVGNRRSAAAPVPGCTHLVRYNGLLHQTDWYVPDSLVWQVDDVVMVMDDSLRLGGCSIAQRLRKAGRWRHLFQFITHGW